MICSSVSIMSENYLPRHGKANPPTPRTVGGLLNCRMWERFILFCNRLRLPIPPHVGKSDPPTLCRGRLHLAVVFVHLVYLVLVDLPYLGVLLSFTGVNTTITLITNNTLHKSSNTV
jgi:hypothetical protein